MLSILFTILWGTSQTRVWSEEGPWVQRTQHLLLVATGSDVRSRMFNLNSSTVALGEGLDFFVGLLTRSSG